MSDLRHTITRRQMLAPAACAEAATLAPKSAFAEDSVDTPPNPERMLTSVPVPDVQTFSIGPSWEQSTQDPGLKSFYDHDGNLYMDPASKVIDVSEWNGTIDWEAVKESGVDAAIIRLGFGYDRADYELEHNITECNRLGIPYGLYLYSYAYDADFAAEEARFTADLIKKYGCTPSLPIFYDLEEWTWTGHTPPATVAAYEAIVSKYCNVMKGKGFGNVRVYSYRTYLYGPLKSSTIWKKAVWAAEYGAPLKFQNPYFEGCLGWQYTSTGACPGIPENVDINAFPPLYKLAFGDVTTKTEHYEDIWWLSKTGISTGFEDGTFRGMSAVARQDMAAFLYRLAGSPSFTPSSADKARFGDVTSSTPHCKEIWWLGSTGIAEGFADGTFRGMSAVARQDMAAFLYRLAVRFIDSSYSSWTPTEADEQLFPDVSSATPHCKEIWWMGALGLSTGFEDGAFRGMSAVARQDMAAFLHRVAAL